MAQTRAKIKAGNKSVADPKDELAAFDILLAKYKDQKTDDVVQIALVKLSGILSSTR